MMRSPRDGLRRRFIAGALAGVAAAVTFATVMEADRRVLGRNTDDLMLLGRFVSPREQTARIVGLGLHLLNGGMLGGVYGAAFHEWLPGAPSFRGALFANAENLTLYPLALLENHHPAIRDGQIDRYWNGTAFAQETLRHVVFGLILGEGTERILRSTR